MKPLGTITMYFPFIDEDARIVLEDIMSKAEDYYDFVKTLTERVIDSQCLDLVVYFAIHHSALMFDLKTINLIAEKYQDRPILLPNLYFASAFQGKPEDLQKVHQSADEFLKTGSDDWLALEMRCMKFEADMRLYPQTMYDVANFDAMTDTITNDPRFDFYNVTLYSYLAGRAHIDGNSEERARCVEIAIESAIKHDDKARLGYLLLTKADITEAEDRKRAMKILRDAIDIFDELGVKAGFANALEKLGRFEAARGEYNLAIEHYQEAVSIRESLNLFSGLLSLLLSTFYNVIGETESGYEWGLMAEDQFKNRPILQPRAVLHQAWALILMGKATEAQLLIDTIRESIHKSGHEVILAWLHFVTGIQERENGDYTAAISSIEEALKIYWERSTDEYIVVIFLHHLAQMELLSSDISTNVSPSLALLEEKAISEDLPGILGQVLLLKAEMAMSQNDDASLRQILRELQPIAQNPTTQFLSPFYERLLKRV